MIYTDMVIGRISTNVAALRRHPRTLHARRSSLAAAFGFSVSHVAIEFDKAQNINSVRSVVRMNKYPTQLGSLFVNAMDFGVEYTGYITVQLPGSYR